MPPRTKAPGPVPKEAVDFFNKKGLKVGFSFRDVWREEHKAAFTIAGVMEKDILNWARAQVAVALETGITFREFAKDMKPLLDKSGWANYGGGKKDVSRLRVIYDTNMRTARAAGQWQRIERTKDILPFLVYELGPSVRHRPVHVSWAGTKLPIDHAFWDDHMPPNGYLCKCHVVQIGERELKRKGGVDKAPSSRKVPWKNKKTGKTEQVPIGIDPGFDFNAGKDRMAGVERKEKEAAK